MFSNVAFSQENNLLTLEKVINSREFSPKSVRGIRPMLDGENFSQIKKDSINAYNYQTGRLSSVIVSSDELVPEGETDPISLNNYQFNKDETKILFATETEAIYRRSAKSTYYIFDLSTRAIQPLSMNGKQQLADFSPDSKSVAFVRENNLFVKNLISGNEQLFTLKLEDRSILKVKIKDIDEFIKNHIGGR